MTKNTYVTNKSSTKVYVSWKDGPTERELSPNEITHDEYFDHPDEWIKISIDRLGGGRVVSNNLVVGNDRSAVIVNGRQLIRWRSGELSMASRWWRKHFLGICTMEPVLSDRLFCACYYHLPRSDNSLGSDNSDFFLPPLPDNTDLHTI